MSDSDLFPAQPVPDETIECDDLDLALDDYIEKKGFRLFSIFPADSPREAVLGRDGFFVRLVADQPAPAADEDARGLSLSVTDDVRWHAGRAGMEYRDLIPGRLGGRLIASHIRIRKGGPAPDYVHFHKLDFQVIYCLRGSCDLVYEDRGDPFRFEAGDCVLQPPGIRHRVLECSDGFEVLELSSPAEHPTFADNSLELPNGRAVPGRLYAGQEFYLLDASEDSWSEPGRDGFERLHTGLYEASGGSVGLTVFRTSKASVSAVDLSHKPPAFIFVTRGAMGLGSAAEELRQELADSSSYLAPADTPLWCATASDYLEFLHFTFPGL